MHVKNAPCRKDALQASQSLLLHAGMHINDSKCALGSRRDRHENVGRGMIGIKMFECIMNDSRLDGAAICILYRNACV